MLVVDGPLTLEPEFANILPLKELLDLLELELFEVEGRETIDRLVVLVPDELLGITLELLLIEGLGALTLALLLVEGLEALTLELLLVEGPGALTLELVDLEELEALAGAELLETDPLLPLDLLPLERDVLAITGPISNIKAKATDSRIILIFFECLRVIMACLLTLLAHFSRFILKSKSTSICVHH